MAMGAHSESGFLWHGPPVARVLTDRPLYDRKPLREAIFELFADPEQPTAWAESSREKLSRAFPDFTSHEEVLHDVGIQLQFADGAMRPKAHAPRIRIRRWDVQRQRAVQFGPHMCAYNVLPGAYTRFEDQVETIKRVVNWYLEEAQPAKLAWIGQRYINTIKLPSDATDVREYFPIYPELPSSLRGHRPLALQVQTAQSRTSEVVVNLGLEEAEDTSDATYTLDIYARSRGEVPADPDALTRWHEKAHLDVHAAFQLSLSNLCRDLFKEAAP